MANQTTNPQQIQIKASDEQLKGSYANMMQIAHTKEEFIMDFMSLLPPSAQLVSRILMSPAHAKRIMTALEENIKKYEAQFNKIQTSDDKPHHFGFKTE